MSAYRGFVIVTRATPLPLTATLPKSTTAVVTDPSTMSMMYCPIAVAAALFDWASALKSNIMPLAVCPELVSGTPGNQHLKRKPGSAWLQVVAPFTAVPLANASSMLWFQTVNAEVARPSVADSCGGLLWQSAHVRPDAFENGLVQIARSAANTGVAQANSSPA